MELSELLAYAKEKYNLEEQHKWQGFPGFSVLYQPGSAKKWLALLIRQWDSEAGYERQFCDLKCDPGILREYDEPYLKAPVRMSKKNWIGIVFDENTSPEIIYPLFDRSVQQAQLQENTIVLEPKTDSLNQKWRDTPILFGQKRTEQDFSHFSLDSNSNNLQMGIPSRIVKMMQLYQFRGQSLQEKARNFYEQGKWMEDYEDDRFWFGEFHRYFPTYHDMNYRQLRGYFAWRTQLRQNNILPVPLSMAYVYIYELLNGIGVHSSEEALQKMKDFNEKFIKAGLGDNGLKKNLSRWMFEYAVLHHLPSEEILPYIEEDKRKMDDALSVLRQPENQEAEKIYSALSFFSYKRFCQSPVFKKHEKQAKALLRRIWKELLDNFQEKDRDFFTLCFGLQKDYRWRPLVNTVYYEKEPVNQADCLLSPVRSLHCRNGIWTESRYDSLNFNRTFLHRMLRAADRLLRRHFKTGGYLKKNPEESIFEPFIRSVLEKAQQEKVVSTSAPKPIRIDFSSLNQIRKDALVTRDSLLSDEEKEEADNELSVVENNSSDRSKNETAGFGRTEEMENTRDWASANSKALEDTESSENLLNPMQRQVLKKVMEGSSVTELLKNLHLMPSVVTDAINEAVFDEVGDSILMYDGNEITFVEDYRNEAEEILERSNDS